MDGLKGMRCTRPACAQPRACSKKRRGGTGGTALQGAARQPSGRQWRRGAHRPAPAPAPPHRASSTPGGFSVGGRKEAAKSERQAPPSSLPPCSGPPRSWPQALGTTWAAGRPCGRRVGRAENAGARAPKQLLASAAMFVCCCVSTGRASELDPASAAQISQNQSWGVAKQAQQPRQLGAAIAACMLTGVCQQCANQWIASQRAQMLSSLASTLGRSLLQQGRAAGWQAVGECPSQLARLLASCPGGPAQFGW